MEKLTADVEVISKLSDSPNADGISAAELKKKFDEAPAAIKEFINTVVVPAIEKLQGGADAGFLAKTGGTIDGNLRITGTTEVSEPTSNSHAATKFYVDGRKSKFTVNLLPGKWNNKLQTVSAPGVTTDRTMDLIVAPVVSDFENYCAAGIRCTEQGNGTLTFACRKVPKDTVSASILILK